MRSLAAAGAFALAVAAFPAQPAGAALPRATPDSQGVSAARLARLHAYFDEAVASGAYLGAVTLVARHGRIVDWRAYGHRDLAKREAMKPESIFRIYSMTKTVATIGLLVLMEEGRLALEDPASKYLPALANMRVFAGGSADAPVLRAPKGPITLRHLLTHTAGFATSGPDGSEAVKLFNRVDLHASKDLDDYVARVGALPLGADPGERFAYDGVNTEVASRVIEVVSGQSLDEFLQARVLRPLRMTDTGFTVPPEKRARLVQMTSTNAAGQLIAWPEGEAPTPGGRMRAYWSGAGGLYSTAGDYARLCQMLMNGGELDGASILSRKTVDLMMTNQLAPPLTAYGDGFGLGGYVVTDVAVRGRPGSVGQYGWSGAASTYYTLDRKEGLIAMLLMQHLPQGLPRDPQKASVRFYNLVYQ
ncbi:MAG TPA: serine hydrolase domain-containing protein, partial [Usitatibacter sp.]|nr:serine hydrolase domain-containing protein [Usitatibacter sp.]